jgi:hypothetical protein
VNGPRQTALEQFSLDIIEITARCRPAVTTIRSETADSVSTGSGSW